jgi:hypothetical protein
MSRGISPVTVTLFVGKVSLPSIAPMGWSSSQKAGLEKGFSSLKRSLPKKEVLVEEDIFTGE